jgi:hypothetical protein
MNGSSLGVVVVEKVGNGDRNRMDRDEYREQGSDRDVLRAQKTTIIAIPDGGGATRRFGATGDEYDN